MTSKGDKVSAPSQGQEKDAEQDALQRQLLLTTAFTEFNQLAGELSQRYQALEQEVLQLRVQLAEQEQQQQRAESDRLAVTEQYEALLDILPLGMVMIDNRGQIRRANPTALALLGEPLEDELWFNVIRRSFAPRKDDGHEISLRSGRRVSVLTNSLPDQAGQIVLLHDLTETRLLILGERLNCDISRQMSSASMTDPGCRINARWMQLSSSRTLPGHLWADSSATAAALRITLALPCLRLCKARRRSANGLISRGRSRNGIHSSGKTFRR